MSAILDFGSLPSFDTTITLGLSHIHVLNPRMGTHGFSKIFSTMRRWHFLQNFILLPFLKKYFFTSRFFYSIAVRTGFGCGGASATDMSSTHTSNDGCSHPL